MRAPTLYLVMLYLAFLPGSSVASEGLKYAAAYMCDPLRIIEATTRLCDGKHGVRSTRYSAVFSAWYQKNASSILSLKSECLAEIKKASSSESEFREMMAKLDQLNTEVITDIESQVGSARASFCDEVFAGMESGKSDLGVFPSQK